MPSRSVNRRTLPLSPVAEKGFLFLNLPVPEQEALELVASGEWALIDVRPKCAHGMLFLPQLLLPPPLPLQLVHYILCGGLAAVLADPQRQQTGWLAGCTESAACEGAGPLMLRALRAVRSRRPSSS